MAPFTEFIQTELDLSTNPEDLISPKGLTWQKAINSLICQPGCLGLQWTRRVESPLWLFIKIDWNTSEARATPYNQKGVEELMATLPSGGIVIRDAAIYIPLTASEVFATAPMTEFLTLLICSSMSSEETTALEQACVKVSNSTAPRPDGVKAVTHAWLTDEVDHPDSSTGKAKALRFLLAWPSLEIHRAIMATEEFKTNMGAIKEKCLSPVYGRGMFHVDFTNANCYSSTDEELH